MMLFVGGNLPERPLLARHHGKMAGLFSRFKEIS